jgi:hypothetical protein
VLEKGRQAKDEVTAKKMLHEAEEKKAKKEIENQANSDPILEDHEGEAQEEKEADQVQQAKPEHAQQAEPEQAAQIQKVEPVSEEAKVEPKEEP